MNDWSIKMFQITSKLWPSLLVKKQIYTKALADSFWKVSLEPFFVIIFCLQKANYLCLIISWSICCQAKYNTSADILTSQQNGKKRRFTPVINKPLIIYLIFIFLISTILALLINLCKLKPIVASLLYTKVTKITAWKKMNMAEKNRA